MNSTFSSIIFFLNDSASNVFRPTELDWIVGIAFRQKNREIALFFEQDRSIDRVGMTQEYLAAQIRYAF